MQHLFDYAEALGIDIDYMPLAHKGRDGEYDHRRQLIRLQPGMSARLKRSVLAHELAHAVFGDVPSKFGPVNAKQERRADEWAALRLIHLDDYREAELIREGHAPSMAHDLGVVTRIVHAYQRVIERELTRTGTRS